MGETHVTQQDAARMIARVDRNSDGKLSYEEFVAFLEGEDAIRKNREIMGATNPAEALAGTLRADYAASIDENAVHGSDAPESAAREIEYFFTAEELCARTR